LTHPPSLLAYAINSISLLHKPFGAAYAGPTYNLKGGFKPTMKRFADLDGPDFFSTPRWATFALIDNEKFSGDIWECACGDGTMSKVLEETGCAVLSSDLYDRGYGEVGLVSRRGHRDPALFGAVDGLLHETRRLGFLDGTR
jgi:hypothetical protein